MNTEEKVFLLRVATTGECKHPKCYTCPVGLYREKHFGTVYSEEACSITAAQMLKTPASTTPVETPVETPAVLGNSEQGIKNDQEKIRLELLSARWIVGVGKVLTFGGRKYAAHNWRKGIAISRLLGACLRHVTAYLGGEDYDPETGLLHLYHASCCLMFASEMHETHPELDDRFKEPPCPKR